VSSDLTDGRAEALLAKEAAVTEEQMRSACVTLADRSLIAADGDGQAAKAMLRDALSAIGAVPYTPLHPTKTSRMQVDSAYRRPGQ
jgi:hypothetical protein